MRIRVGITLLQITTLVAAPMNLRAQSNAVGDTAFTASIEFMSGGVTLHGVAYIASGADPHPTVVRLRGFPGGGTADFERYLQSQGINAILINFRGQLTSEGRYTVDGTPDDASAAVAFLRSDSARKALRIDPDRIALVGTSAGSYAALRATGRDSSLSCVGLIVPFNFTVAGLAARADSSLRRRYEATVSSLSAGTQAPIRADTSFAATIVDHAERYDLSAAARTLGGRKVYLIGAQDDQTAPLTLHFYPLTAALRSALATVRDTIVADSHNLTTTSAAAYEYLGRSFREDCWR